MNNYEGDRLITHGLSSLFMGGIAEGNSAELMPANERLGWAPPQKAWFLPARYR
jgi:hypothetical protein